MNLFVKILLFILVALVVNVNITNATTIFTSTQETTTSISFHKDKFKKTFKAYENNLANCYQSGRNLVDYKKWGKVVEADAAKVVTNLIPEGKLANHLFKGAGKLADNPANRTLIQKIANGKPLVVDKFGKSWYRGVDAAGNGVYSYTQNGIVKGAGYTNFNNEQLINHIIKTVGIK
ncbi:MAG: hypothetical protein LC107_06445 [Chitinophagales bacterium]|nr:hypothetical protein [Chitinophagales bacterium]